MIAFRFTKTDGAEYLSHLDLFRHIDRTLRRAGIKVKTSEGFNPHQKIFMNNPLGLGIKSVAEYCAVDCDFEGDFAEAFNAHSPAGIKCTAYMRTDKNPNYAYTLKSCTYCAEGITPFDTAEFMQAESIPFTDWRGREIDLRKRIYALDFKEDKLYFTLGVGENNLRPDTLCNYLENLYGGKAVNICKISADGDYTF